MKRKSFNRSNNQSYMYDDRQRCHFWGCLNCCVFCCNTGCISQLILVCLSVWLVKIFLFLPRMDRWAQGRGDRNKLWMRKKGQEKKGRLLQLTHEYNTISWQLTKNNRPCKREKEKREREKKDKNPTRFLNIKEIQKLSIWILPWYKFGCSFVYT